jgi:hypothetical protein
VILAVMGIENHSEFPGPFDTISYGDYGLNGYPFYIDRAIEFVKIFADL